MNSQEFFNAVKNKQLKLSNAEEKQQELLNEISPVKIGKKTDEQEKVIKNVNKFYLSRAEVITFLKIMQKWSTMQATK